MLDQETASAIRSALEAAAHGRIHDARRIGEQGLATGGDVVALNAMLGNLCCRTGDLAAGIRHLRIARSNRPGDVVIALNLASALAEQGQFAEALEVLPEVLATNDPTMRVERLRGFLHLSLRDFPAAIAAYERVVRAAPDDWEIWNNLGNARRQNGDADGSVDALKQAAQLNPRSAPTRLNLAMTLISAGDPQAAESELRSMATDFPADAKPVRELHALLKDQGRDEDALEPIVEAVRRDPADLELLLGLASHRLLLLDNERAEQAYREVIRRDPGNALANLGLAVVFELGNRSDDLARLGGEAEARGVDHTVVKFIHAFDHRRARRFEEGLAALADVPEGLEEVRRLQLLGQLSEGAGRYDQAWEAFAAVNRIQAEHPSDPIERGAAYRAHVRAQTKALSKKWLSRWTAHEPEDGLRSPVFLVGFPRSGTTLLDTLLMGHPDVEVLEEEPTLVRAAEHLPLDIDELPAATAGQVDAARARYYAAAAEHIPLAPGKLLIDKNPLSMNALPVIRRLFPDARVIVAVRHPCDVVLSCFVTNFRLNDGMSSFLRLGDAAELYDLSFRNFTKAQRLLGVPVHRVVYEDVVEDPESALRGLLTFLELPWRDEMLDHELTAKNRGRVKTASYAQVVEPIYRRSRGRWQHYREHMEPVLPVLAPWAEQFGYSL
jgi:tetratricopeptide (TPR) repeat protein